MSTTARSANGRTHTLVEHITNKRGEQFTITTEGRHTVLHDHQQRLAYNSSLANDNLATVKEWAERERERTTHDGRAELSRLGSFYDNYVPQNAWPDDEAEDWKAKYDELWEELHKEANRRGFCEEYDKFAEQHGGPKRPRRVTARLGFVIPIMTTEDAAEPLFDPNTTTPRQRQQLVQQATVDYLIEQGYLSKHNTEQVAFAKTIVRTLVATSLHTSVRH